MSGIGHNSATFGEGLEDRSPVLSDDHKKLFHYVQWHLADYITGTQGMTPEQEGIYMRFLARLYDRGQAFCDDDKMLALAMGLDVRRWRRIRADLIGFGKIIIKHGHLTNSRFEREKLKRAEDLRKQAENTKKYWEKKRHEDQLRAEVGAKSGQSPREVRGNFGEKANEINEIVKLPTSQTRDQRLETREERKEEDSVPDGTGSELPEASLRELVWTKCISWLLPRSCLDEVRLRVRVGRWVQEFGAGAVIDAVAIAQKEAPVSIMAYVEGVLRRRAAQPVTAGKERMAPWEEKELQIYNDAQAALKRLSAKYALEQNNG